MLSQPGSVSASPLGSTSTAVSCASSTSNSSPADDGRGSFFRVCSYHGRLRRLTPARGRVRLTLPENANSCSCASSTCAIASESRRIAYGTWTRRRCAWFQQASVGGARRALAFVTVTLAANMRSGMWTQIVCEGRRPSAAAWTTLSAPARVQLSDALDHAGRSPGHDRRD